MPVKDVTTKEKHREMKHHGLPENGEWGPLEKEHGWLLKAKERPPLEPPERNAVLPTP